MPIKEKRKSTKQKREKFFLLFLLCFLFCAFSFLVWGVAMQRPYLQLTAKESAGLVGLCHPGLNPGSPDAIVESHKSNETTNFSWNQRIIWRFRLGGRTVISLSFFFLLCFFFSIFSLYSLRVQSGPMKDTWSIFDIIGPVMVGPSSSHTAGACKLGYMARIIFGKTPTKCVLRLHGSFAEVYKGHCTDVALVGGMLGMSPSDPDMKNAYSLAEKAGMEIELVKINLGTAYHRNTVQFILYDGDRKMSIVGSSIGGGKVIISSIDKVDVAITGSYSSLLVCFDNTCFDLNHLLYLMTSKNISIVKMETTQYKERSIIDIEIRESFNRDIILEIEKICGVYWARFINHLSHFVEVGM